MLPAAEMRAKARRLHLERKLDLVVVDFLQLMHGGIRSENRVQEVSHISRSLKELARDLDVPVIACSQLSRAAESRAPPAPRPPTAPRAPPPPRAGEKAARSEALLAREPEDWSEEQ